MLFSFSFLVDVLQIEQTWDHYVDAYKLLENQYVAFLLLSMEVTELLEPVGPRKGVT